jgi:23S rRNA-/tRNA-specific pseudouridylate synthase
MIRHDILIDGEVTTSPTIEQLLQSSFPQHEKFYLIHQLDYVTSGIHCWALNKRAASRAYF